VTAPITLRSREDALLLLRAIVRAHLAGELLALAERQIDRTLRRSPDMVACLSGFRAIASDLSASYSSTHPGMVLELMRFRQEAKKLLDSFQKA
jgi:hypothetical protein